MTQATAPAPLTTWTAEDIRAVYLEQFPPSWEAWQADAFEAFREGDYDEVAKIHGRHCTDSYIMALNFLGGLDAAVKTRRLSILLAEASNRIAMAHQERVKHRQQEINAWIFGAQKPDLT